ncbi:RNase H domain-containing protein [Trichonephila clavipes]|nr:RNase H domain-containing protein [Trichonephila clavipes]
MEPVNKGDTGKPKNIVIRPATPTAESSLSQKRARPFPRIKLSKSTFVGKMSLSLTLLADPPPHPGPALAVSLPREKREELLASTPKHSSHPELLRQLALEVINDIPDQALIIYTDGSRSDTGRAGSGIFSNTPGNDVKISIRNPDYCSVFRSELIAISGALDHALNSYNDSIWILTDSRSSIQYLKNRPKIMDSTGIDILSKLVRLGQRKQVCLQWIPWHVGVPENEAADELAGRGCDLLTPVPLS